MKTAIVLLSGGMDSCVTVALVREAGYDVAALHVNYGQRTQQRELQAFTDICDHYAIRKRLICDISHLAAIGGSSLTDTTIVVSKANLTSKEIPSSYVPFRNANILAIATSWAEVCGAQAIAIGAVEEDSSGYPDCRDVFFRAFEHVIATGTKPETTIRILTPVIHLSKADIVREGIRLNAPLHHTWSCYQGEGLACGECDSCALRLRGFYEAGTTDPIPYAIRP
ncbi:MAG: 7-cyano-7-deazaguanine synthase QueC [Candidatus Kapabacteria bacterium]|jgi:7-cyano-7-deazaguanine synthase|nr:7-cyano-7-deazaguanine synthase QueC [Candidatus Kapabacteria bacterium]